MLLVTFVRERERRARIHTLSGGICLSFSLSLSLSVAPSITHTHTCSHADVLKTKMKRSFTCVRKAYTEDSIALCVSVYASVCLCVCLFVFSTKRR